MSFQTAFDALITRIENNFAELVSRISTVSSKLEGEWTKSNVQIASGLDLNNSNNQTYNLTSYLPSDNGLYEIEVTADVTTGTTSGNEAAVRLIIDGYDSDVWLCSARTTANGQAKSSGSCIITAHRYDSFKIKRATTYKGSCNITFLKYKRSK